MQRSGKRYRTATLNEKRKRLLVFALLYFNLVARAAAIHNHAGPLQLEKKPRKSLNSSVQSRTSNTELSFNSVLNHLSSRIEDGNIVIRKVSRCYGRDVRSQNCRKCVKSCVKQSKSLPERFVKSDEGLFENTNLGGDEVSLHMCPSSECMSCVDSCRGSYGREFYIVTKPPGAKCENIL